MVLAALDPISTGQELANAGVAGLLGIIVVALIAAFLFRKVVTKTEMDETVTEVKAGKDALITELRAQLARGADREDELQKLLDAAVTKMDALAAGVHALADARSAQR